VNQLNVLFYESLYSFLYKAKMKSALNSLIVVFGRVFVCKVWSYTVYNETIQYFLIILYISALFCIYLQNYRNNRNSSCFLHCSCIVPVFQIPQSRSFPIVLVVLREYGILLFLCPIVPVLNSGIIQE